MKYSVKITADHNNADYVSRESVVDDEELEFLKRFINLIAKEQGKFRTYDYAEYERPTPEELYPELSEDDINRLIDDYLPDSEHGIHTIVSVEYSPEIKWTKLF